MSVDNAVDKVNRHQSALYRWLEVNALLIDECRLFIPYLSLDIYLIVDSIHDRCKVP